MKVVQGLEAELTNKFLIALAECASDSNLDNGVAVTRTLAGEAPGQGPIPRRGGLAVPAPRAEAKEANPPMQAQAKAAPTASIPEDRKPVAKGGGEISPMDMPAERGKSRGGTRGGKPNQATADAGLSSGPPIRLDGEIERCDGSEVLTQQLLGELITRPKLTEKLLQRPPFKFIFDIVLEVIRSTGFGRGLYTEAEMDKENVNSREQKVEFLDKILSLVGRQLGTIVEARSAKIIAGQDAPVTNNFLQLLALAAKHLPDSTQAVRAILEQGGGSAALEQAGPPVAVAAPAPSTRADAKPVAAMMTSPADEVKRPSPAVGAKPSAPPPQQQQQQQHGHQMSSPDAAIIKTDPMTAADDKDGGDGDGEDGSGDVKRSTRPTTARRRPPKVKDGATEVTAKDTSANHNNNTSSQAKKASGIIVDGAGNNDDDIDEAIDDASNNNNRLVDEYQRTDSKPTNEQSTSGAQSKLVQNIMSRQVEQEAASRGGKVAIEAAEETKGNDAAPSGGIRLNRMRSSTNSKTDKNSANAAGGNNSNASAGNNGGANIAQTFAEGDIEKMRNAIQSLVQQTGPLGTCLDFIQEDISLMNAELHKWEEECRRYEVEYEDAKRKTKEKLHPLRSELADLEDQIAEQLAVIAASKASNFKLEDKIQSTLKMIATA